MSYMFNPLFQKCVNQIHAEVKKELRWASDRKLRSIVRGYKKIPLVVRLIIPKYSIGDPYLEYTRHLRYETAKMLLLGDLNWKLCEREESLREELKRKKELEELERAQLLEKARKILLFRGDLFELEKLTGEKFEIICTGTQTNQVYYNACREDILERLGKRRIDALIHYKDERYIDSAKHHGCGIPVRRIETS